MPQAHEIAIEARKEKGLSQEEWAERAGVTRSQVRLFEGGANVKRNTLEKLLAPLGITMLFTSKPGLEEIRRELEEVEVFLGRMERSVESLSVMLAPMGVALTFLNVDEVAKARAAVRDVLRYVGSIEVQATQAERRRA